MAVWIRSGWRAAVDLVLLLILIALQAYGLYGYVVHQVLIPVWLWENQDYMMYLWPVYYHAHIVLMIGHLYLWGPFLIARRFRRPGWSLYWTSFLIAFPISTYPLLGVQRFAAIHGAGRTPRSGSTPSCWDSCSWSCSCGAVRGVQSSCSTSSRGFRSSCSACAGWRRWAFPTMTSSGVGRAPRRDRGLLPPTEPAPAPGEVPDGPPRRSILAGLVGLVLLIVVGAASVAYTPIHLLFAKYQVQQLLDGVGYALKPVAPPLEDKTPPPDYLRFRTYDGSWNNVDHPEVGRAGTPLGRYIPESGLVARDVMAEPTVIQISDRLLKQDDFRSAAPFNALAMAWVNFFVHDFYNRGVTDTQDTDPNRQYYKIPTDDGKFLYIVKLPSVNDDSHTHLRGSRTGSMPRRCTGRTRRPAGS